MALILKRHGFAVCEAGTVAEAMAALGAKPGWVLLDLLLPDGCGIDVLKALKSDGGSSKVCVITGCGPGMLEEVRRMGPEHVLTKPLDVGRLIEVLTA